MEVEAEALLDPEEEAEVIQKLTTSESLVRAKIQYNTQPTFRMLLGISRKDRSA